MLFTFVLTFTLMVQTQLVAKTSVSLAHTKPVVLNSTSSHYVLYCYVLAEMHPGRHMHKQTHTHTLSHTHAHTVTPVTLKNFLFEAVKVIRPQPLTYFCVMKREVRIKHFCCWTKYIVYSMKITMWLYCKLY